MKKLKAGALLALSWLSCSLLSLPAMAANSKQPDYIMDFAKHRHRGFDVYLVTQGLPHLPPNPENRHRA